MNECPLDDALPMFSVKIGLVAMAEGSRWVLGPCYRIAVVDRGRINYGGNQSISFGQEVGRRLRVVSGTKSYLTIILVVYNQPIERYCSVGQIDIAVVAEIQPCIEYFSNNTAVMVSSTLDTRFTFVSYSRDSNISLEEYLCWPRPLSIALPYEWFGDSRRWRENLT